MEFLKNLKERIAGPEQTKSEGLPAHVKAERRSGRRVPLPLDVQLQSTNGTVRAARVRDVNLPGLAVEPAGDTREGDVISISFAGYPDVAPPFSLIGQVKRVVPAELAGQHDALGIEIDRQSTPDDARRHYRSLVMHYLHHRPLLDTMSKGFFEARCQSCEWVGRVGNRNPKCSKCGGVVEAT